MENNDENLSKQLESLKKELKKLNSFGRSFFLAIIKGLGFTIGAGIIAGLITSLLIIFIKNLHIKKNLDQYLRQQFPEYSAERKGAERNLNPADMRRPAKELNANRK